MRTTIGTLSVPLPPNFAYAGYPLPIKFCLFYGEWAGYMSKKAFREKETNRMRCQIHSGTPWLENVMPE